MWIGFEAQLERLRLSSWHGIYTGLFIATAKAVRTAQRLKSPLVLQSPPTRTEI
ncbi:hypothetical protein [Chamaesiphon sp.]|uniref:hypothetical protein n=1 Tax=Chamaesiphon sp. TaxID=2814140 RepID=UPI0035944805